MIDLEFVRNEDNKIILLNVFDVFLRAFSFTTRAIET
jgi:hypothetical protein